MGALSRCLSWTMEDDFKLRKAAETGTSFESLARGDVRFSKRFTIQQLQDRWLAILYDPVVSAESSARMVEFEHADSAPVIKTNHLGDVEEYVIPACGKRKPESIRKRFYAMQKKTRQGQTQDEPPAPDFCGPLQNDEPVGLLTYEAAHTDDIMNLDVNEYYNGNNNCNEEESDGFEEILELLDAKEPELLPPIIDEPNIESFDGYPIIQDLPNVNPGDAEPENHMCGVDGTAAVGNSTNSYLINDLFDLTMEDNDLPLMDADGNLIDMSYLDDMSSHWLESPGNNSNDAKHNTVLVNEFLDNNMDQPECGNQGTKTLDGLSMAPFKPPLTPAIICTLNTEDPDIPSNDDVFLLNLVPSTSQEMQMDVFKPPLPPQLTSKSSSRASGADSKRDFRVAKQITPKNNRYEQSRFSSPIIGSQLRSETQVDHRIKQDFANEDQSQVCPAIISRSSLFPASDKATTAKSEQELPHFSSVRTVSDNKTGGYDIFTNHALMNPMTTIQQEETIHVEIVSTEVDDLILDSRSLLIQEEEAISSQSDDDVNDNDIPDFSDVEAMILDEDSSLDEQQLYLNRIGSSELLRTFRYENVETQKRIMRLEKAANTFVQREMKLHGAFAILQGRHTKYYVKKPEVLIGRATEEISVDIDLGREGQNSRVSRRQAIMHMDHEGSFHMKNLSKYSIFINSMELTTNQSVSLTSSCLIEIKGMAFLFETNEARIKEYVNSTKNITVVIDS
ncbi:hypothetical protein QVD17_39060 [Tagetes erecta]|uniref:FHA domain-containing protein n=1 Tax=Tagetes erecta TaxID=13708 RepID=A0AAD8JQ13_TARER|nr:hypothetical protein QVD17_39060 [Tagetes erecta]